MIKPDKIEERRYQFAPVEIEERAEGDANVLPIIKGTPIVFGVESNDLGGFTEIVDPGAMSGADVSDILAVIEHDEDSLLARTANKTLRLSTTRQGVQVEIDPIDTQDGIDAVKLVRRGDIRGMSFKFSTLEDSWTNKEDGSVLRTILKFKKIFDVSLVARPAYPQTEVALRSLTSWQENKTPELPQTPDVVEEVRSETPPTLPAPEGDPLAWYKAKNKSHRNSILPCQ